MENPLRILSTQNECSSSVTRQIITVFNLINHFTFDCFIWMPFENFHLKVAFESSKSNGLDSNWFANKDLSN